MVRKEKKSCLQRYNLLLIAAGGIAALLLFSGWEMRRGVVAVLAEKALRQQIATTISTNGKVEPVQNFEAHAPAPATVKRVLVNNGDQVKTGQLLLQLEDSDARAQAAKALAQLRAAEADLHAVQSGGPKEEVLTTGSDIEKTRAHR